MQIDRNTLNFVMPIERENGMTVHVYATPISRAVFERYYMVMAKTFNTIYSGGLGIMSGPRVAAMILKDTAIDLGVWEGSEGVERGLIMEIRRLTNVFVPTPNGWETIPIHEAIAKGHLDEDDMSEVENALAFFTVASHMHRKTDRKGILDGASKLWGARLESLSSSEYCASLSKSTTGGTSAAKPQENAKPRLQIPA
jgi:hypothetical protein